MKYKRFDGTSWDASATTFVSSGVTYPACDYVNGGSTIKCIWNQSGNVKTYYLVP